MKIPGVQIHNPDIDGLLPVYVKDPYPGFEVKTFPEMTEAELDRYIAANVAAVQEVAAEAGGIDAALANHLVMGPAILARADIAPFAAKIHGSALEYTVKPHPRFLPYAYEGMEAARGVLVGSAHTGESLWAALPDLPDLRAKTRLGPPGVDVEEFAPIEAARDPLVVFVGKLIVSKGVDLLLAAWPLVRAKHPERAPPGGGLRRLRGRPAPPADGARPRRPRGRPRRRRGRLGARGGRGEAAADPLRLPRRPAAGLRRGRPRRRRLGRVAGTAGARRGRRPASARRGPGDALDLPRGVRDGRGRGRLAPARLPVSAGHSGMREVSERLSADQPPAVAPLTSFPIEPGAVQAIADRLDRWLELPEVTRAEARATLVDTVARLWSWEGVARGVLDAAAGNLGGLPIPAP